MRSCAIVLHRGPVSVRVRPLLLGAALRSVSSRRQVQFAASTGAVHATGVAVSALGEQRRTQYAQMPGKREQEAFLSQFDPLEVLDLPSDSTVEDIDAAFEKAKAKYGPNGKYPDAKMVDRVFQAYEILKDPDSPYYLKAHSSQTDRQRLQFQLLPKSKRRLIEFQVCLLMLIVFGVAVLVMRLVLRPMNRSIRAATR
ncbi:conserved hypothetical protein [Leishmania major strain Friedlin]|uniref:J domain-containing protein n=1 Tax=Leishmania major TaxID=5664 RepID=Q4QA39_LEIMA|nr:conserved hypothetical protein [Leishmania major strain Friedlin]CAG9575065.1 DnaJ_domain_containing_protein_-_putative [Leishmania major strain Friedlin]CAJ04796.1 conserved hypothetical protein [Leishmania major strain Friedlin]|eukprot:XP_001683809.1 conserved hypothetical protein [Leishmania major strain Friedlin]